MSWLCIYARISVDIINKTSCSMDAFFSIHLASYISGAEPKFFNPLPDRCIYAGADSGKFIRDGSIYIIERGQNIYGSVNRMWG